jgi:hypothetical protein
MFDVRQEAKPKRRLSARSRLSDRSSQRSASGTTSGKGHASLNYSQRLAQKNHIESENEKILMRMQRVKSTMPSKSYYKQHYRQHQKLRQSLQQIRFATPNRSQKSTPRSQKGVSRLVLDLSKLNSGMDSSLYNRKFGNPASQMMIQSAGKRKMKRKVAHM